MSIESFIKKVCVQPMVYWGDPVEDGYGTCTFSDPIEIKCRWEDKRELVSDSTGQEQVCDASILVTQDLMLHGYVFLGSLNDIDSDQYDYPMKVDGARKILAFDKIPLFKSTTKFVRKIYVKKGTTR